MCNRNIQDNFSSTCMFVCCFYLISRRFLSPWQQCWYPFSVKQLRQAAQLHVRRRRLLRCCCCRLRALIIGQTERGAGWTNHHHQQQQQQPLHREAAAILQCWLLLTWSSSRACLCDRCVWPEGRWMKTNQLLYSVVIMIFHYVIIHK